MNMAVRKPHPQTFVKTNLAPVVPPEPATGQIFKCKQTIIVKKLGVLLLRVFAVQMVVSEIVGELAPVVLELAQAEAAAKVH